MSWTIESAAGSGAAEASEALANEGTAIDSKHGIRVSPACEAALRSYALAPIRTAELSPPPFPASAPGGRPGLYHTQGNELIAAASRRYQHIRYQASSHRAIRNRAGCVGGPLFDLATLNVNVPVGGFRPMELDLHLVDVEGRYRRSTSALLVEPDAAAHRPAAAAPSANRQELLSLTDHKNDPWRKVAAVRRTYNACPAQCLDKHFDRDQFEEGNQRVQEKQRVYFHEGVHLVVHRRERRLRDRRQAKKFADQDVMKK